MSILSIDFETRSAVDLRKTGVYVYAEDASTDIWCMAWGFDDEEPEIWTPADCHGDGWVAAYAGLPTRVVNHILDGGEIRAWNAQFERIIWREIMVKRYGAPAVAIEQWVCSAAEAAAMALPRNLDQAARVLGVKHQKDDEGHSLMLRMSKPRKVNADGTYIWWDVPDRVHRLKEYCKQDERTERSVIKALRRLTPNERRVYLLDQRVNDRGIRIDRELVAAGDIIVTEGVRRANERIAVLTAGEVTAVTNNNRLVDWLQDNDVETSSIAKPALAALLEREDLAQNVVDVLKLRAEAGRSSVAKLKSMVAAACRDAQARGLLLYHAASTGRWAGRLIQPQNLPRGEVDNVEAFIPAVLAADYDEIDCFAAPIVVVLSMLRAMMTARPGHELIAGDFSAIEARVLNWLAGQEDVCDAFRQYDAGDKRMDPYKRMAVMMGRAGHVDLITKDDRQAGKAAELGCGFGMGWKKYISAAWTVYQVRVNERESKTAVDVYRSTHEKVVQLWYDTELACINAVRAPGQVQRFGARMNLRAVVAGAYLYVVLPSGRPLCYAAPHLADRLTPWGEMKASLHYKGVDPFTKQWGVLSTYGGALVENIVQAVARDLMAEAMFRAEDAGYMPILSVHDEVVTEVPEGFGGVNQFEQLMAALPAWAEGCPVAAEAWRGARYRK